MTESFLCHFFCDQFLGLSGLTPKNQPLSCTSKGILCYNFPSECFKTWEKHWKVSGGPRNFKTWGLGPGAIQFFGSEVCFDAPFIHNICFVVRLKKRMNIVNIA